MAKTKVTEEQWDSFFELLAETGNVTFSALEAGFTKNTVYVHLRKARKDDNTEFLERWAEAKELGKQSLRDEIQRRAVLGVEEDVYYKGQVVGQKKVYSDTLLIFQAKAVMPEEYSERKVVDINNRISVTLDQFLEAKAREKIVEGEIIPDPQLPQKIDEE